MSGILLASVGNSYGSAPVNTVAPVVSGTATFGQTLSTTNGTWLGAPAPTFTYQWFRSPSTSIGGATSSTYVLVEGDIGFGIFCRVRATNTIAPSGVTADSNTTAAVAGIAPVNTVAPVVSGTATFGQTLSTTNGTWTGVPTPTFTYQWFRSPSTSIGGATSSTYVLVAADVGNTIFCTVTATNVVSAVGANSNTTATVAATVPGAPTIGTATATSSSTATVPFTQPASNGGSAITSYTATSSPSGITGTLSQAGSGTITVSGLSPVTSYTFTVTATNAIGTSAASAASNSVTTSALAVGDAYAGGFYAGQIGVSSVATHNLVVGPVASAQSGGNIKWKNANSSTAGADSDIDGPQNTADMVADGDATVYPAAHFCNDLTIGGYSDWYMPAKNEVEVCYYNLKPTTGANNTSSGSNTNAVPSRGSNYTGGAPATNPAQTSAVDFQDTNAQAFAGNAYWTSTEYSSIYGGRQRFDNGFQGYSGKTNGAFVRAVRRVAV